MIVTEKYKKPLQVKWFTRECVKRTTCPLTLKVALMSFKKKKEEKFSVTFNNETYYVHLKIYRGIYIWIVSTRFWHGAEELMHRAYISAMKAVDAEFISDLNLREVMITKNISLFNSFSEERLY